jgi:hypothetical protein
VPGFFISFYYFGSYKLPFKNGEVTDVRRAVSIEVYGELGVIFVTKNYYESLLP